VRSGAMNVNTVASDNDRCCREKYIPERVTKLKITENSSERPGSTPHPVNPRRMSNPRTSCGPSNGFGIFRQYLTNDSIQNFLGTSSNKRLTCTRLSLHKLLPYHCIQCPYTRYREVLTIRTHINYIKQFSTESA